MCCCCMQTNEVFLDAATLLQPLVLSPKMLQLLCDSSLATTPAAAEVGAATPEVVGGATHATAGDADAATSVSSSRIGVDLIRWRHVYFGSSVAAMSKGCSIQQLQQMFLRSSVCSRAFDRKNGQVYSKLPGVVAASISNGRAAAGATGQAGGLNANAGGAAVKA